jgi:uncharacterized protein with PQ loop repeat
MDIFGWLGALLLGGSALPQTWQSIKDGHTRGLNWYFLGMWFFGEVCMIVYIIPKMDIALLANYLFNFVLLLIMIRYKIWERDDNKIQNSLKIVYTERYIV